MNKRQYHCDICDYIYDPAQGCPEEGIAPGTPWEEISDDWVCPECGASKELFSEVIDSE
ncbi:rubredoxin [Aestuariirhabdus sp. LZHN29]|uniref:rubredoxin n=1 Tax=Aestuariirhabdus sp. LZHN29 TaxID=3417462 RepID=UPI003CF0366E